MAIIPDNLWASVKDWASSTPLGQMAQGNWQGAGQAIQRGLQGQMAAPPQQTAADWAMPGVGFANIFAGVGAKTANKALLESAKSMEKAGIPYDQIWKETGWALNTPDKLPRFEIPDNSMLVDTSRGSGYGVTGPQSVIQHEKLAEAYPKLENLFVKHEGILNRGGSGSFDETAYLMRILASDQEKARKMAAHESQHAVQSIENFERGGSQTTARQYTPEYKQYQRMKDSMTPAEQRAAYNAIPRDYEAYRRLMGEAEARLAEARLNMTPEERIAQYPYDPNYFWSTTGVPLEKLVSKKQ